MPHTIDGPLRLDTLATLTCEKSAHGASSSKQRWNFTHDGTLQQMSKALQHRPTEADCVMLPTAPPSNIYGAATGLTACKSVVSPQLPAQVTLEPSGDLRVKDTGLCLRAGGFLQIFSKRIEARQSPS